MKSIKWGTPLKPPVYALVLMLLLAGLVVGLTGCGIIASTATPETTVQPTATVAGATAIATEPPQGTADVGPEEGSIRVPLVVVQAPGGATLALVPVTINGQGPYRFALDTGASSSLIDGPLADQLSLKVVGSAGQVTGVAGSANADLVHIQDWQAGTVKLPPSDVVKLSLGSGGGGGQLQGLLGSDILSQYGAIQVDYANQVLILTPR